MTKRRFESSFHPKVKPPAGQKCALKWHFSGVMRELVGYLDEMAALDPTGERFVYTHVQTIIENENCKRFKGKAYGPRAIKYAFAELRERWILSKTVVRERWVPSGEKGHEVLRELDGSIMAPHDCIATPDGDECQLVGWPGVPGTHWNFEPRKRVYWTAKPVGSESAQPVARASALPSALTIALPSAQASALPVALDDSAHISDNANDSAQNGDQAVVTVIPGVSRREPEKPEQPVKPAPPVQAAAQVQTQTGPSPSSSLSGAGAPNQRDDDKPLGSEITIGAQFLPQKDMDLLIQLTDGIFNPHAYKETGEIDVLVKYARAAVAEDAALPWDKQRTTLARIVDQVAKCAAADGLKQKGWFKTLKELQQSGPCKKNYAPPPLTNAQQLAANRAKGFVGIPVTQRHGMNGQTMYLCSDRIYRLAGDRDHNGFTVPAADGVWDKP